MTNSQRIIVNTAAQYTRTIINVCLSLYSTRLILAALGQSDYGIYSVVGGVVAMLSFVTNALVTTTQRYLSFYHGAGNKDKIRLVFGNSMLLHILIGVIAVVVLGAIGPWVIHHLLNITPERLEAALVVYYAAVLMLLLSFLTAPVRALFIARENIVYISIVDVLDGVLKLLIAIWLSHITYDRLITYAGAMTSISLFNLLAFVIFAAFRFEECHWPRLREWNREYIKDLSGFTGWIIYSTGCVIARTQGVAILLNNFIGSAVNAAYGISLQVSGAVQFISASLLNAMRPQIVKAEGVGERQHMLLLAATASKMAFLLLAAVAIPLIWEMPAILSFWLSDVPPYTVMFCRFILIASLCDQLTVGLISAIEAIGDIRNYSLVINSIKILTLPCAWLCLYYGFPMASVMWFYIGFEFICAIARLPFLKHVAGLSIKDFSKRVFMRIWFPLCIMIFVGFIVVNYVTLPYRFIWTLIISGISALIAIWFTGLDKTERDIMKKSIQAIIRR